MRKSLLIAALSACLPMFMSDVQAAAPSVPQDPADGGGVVGAVAAETPLAAEGATGGDGAGESGNVAASPVDAPSESDTSSSASSALQDAGTAEGSDSEEAGEPDHKSILEKLFVELEGIVHMGKSEIVAVIERAKALL